MNDGTRAGEAVASVAAADVVERVSPTSSLRSRRPEQRSSCACSASSQKGT